MEHLAIALGTKAHYDGYLRFKGPRDAEKHAVEQVGANYREFGRPVVFDRTQAIPGGISARYYGLVNKALGLGNG